MKLENKRIIKIGGLNVDLKFVTSDELEGDCGSSDQKAPYIKIDKDMSDDLIILTLLHEIFHHIDPGLSESKVELYSRAWFQIFKDNDLL